MSCKNILTVKKIGIVLLLLFFLSVLPLPSAPIFAADTPQNITDTQNISTPGLDSPSFEVIEFDSKETIGEFVKYIIIWAFRLAGVFAFIMILFAGFQYLTAGGNSNQQKESQERIFNAIIGIILLFSFWLILNTINPDILGPKQIEISPPLTDEEKQDILSETQEEIPGDIIQINDILPIAQNTFGYPDAYLNSVLVNKLIPAQTSPPSWYITDACIDSICSSTSVPNREATDCHLDGTCVDIDAGDNDDNYNMISTFTDAGLYVLDEGDHLHITLPSASGYGTYQGITNISQGTWYLP